MPNGENQIQPFLQPSWEGGINTSKPPTEIDNSEAVDILNLQLDPSDNLVSRLGVVKFHSTGYTDRITSLHHYISESGTSLILYTLGTKLFKANTDGTGVTEITGSLTLPSNKFSQWRTFGGLAIGVNGATSGDNPVKVTSAGTAAALGGTPPKAKYIEIWNNRVWLVSATAPNQIRASALGLPEDWTTTGAAGTISLDIDPDDGDRITGIIAFKGRLFVFKRKKIYVVTQGGDPFTLDGGKIVRDIFNSNIGCVSGYTIQTVLDDVLFLSEGGVASLRTAEVVAEFRSALVSRKVSEIAQISKIHDEIASYVLDDVSQYWLSIPDDLSPTNVPVVYVFDYKTLLEQQLRWVRFDGLVCGTAFTSLVSSTGKNYLIAAKKGTQNFIFKYVPETSAPVYTDDGDAYTKILRTKAYTQGLPLIRKQHHEWTVGFGLITAMVSVTVQYILDLNSNKSETYAFGLAAGVVNALYDVGLYDVDLYDTETGSIDVDVRRIFKASNVGNMSQNVTFVISGSTAGQAFSVKNLQMLYSVLSGIGVSEV